MDNSKEVKDEVNAAEKKFPLKKIFYTIFILSLAYFVGYIHYKYVSNLFENDRNFSYLSELEREMSLRTEMGFYYSYYKMIVEEKDYVSLLSKLMYDRLVEYPKDVNALNRFNIPPEVIIGSIYRYFEPVLNTTTYRVCHTVERGGGVTPVESCVGVGQPIFFYLEAIWWLAGLTVAALFLHAVTLSQSILGGFLAVIQYFANHAECTRVQWAPNERENFALPFILLQTWLLTLQLREKGKIFAFKLQICISFLDLVCLLSWQFTQFIFLTQIAIFFLMEQLRIINNATLSMFLNAHFCGLYSAVLLLQGNDMLKSSLFVCYFTVICLYCLCLSSLRVKVNNRLDLLVEAWFVVHRVALSIYAAFYLKKALSDMVTEAEDTHIWDILYSKFTNFDSFHTLIYTCSEVFDFLPLATVKRLVVSLLIPTVLFNIYNISKYWYTECAREIEKGKEEKKNADKEDDGNVDDEDSGIENSEKKITPVDLDLVEKKVEGKVDDNLVQFLRNLAIDPAIFYNVMQGVVFGLMAILVMRLKLLFVTQLCILSSLLFNRKYYVLPKTVSKYLPIFWASVIILVLRALFLNSSEEMLHIGEFNDYPQEQLLQWISREAGAGAFAGSMPVLAAVMLSTRRPIVAHPHYEHLEARQRAYAVYKMYGKFTSYDFYKELNRLRATYLIVETKYCYGRSNKGCSFEQIWDIEVPALKSNPKLCHILLTETVEHYYPVFRNEHYAVFRINDFSVRYMPRCFDT